MLRSLCLTVQQRSVDNRCADEMQVHCICMEKHTKININLLQI